MDNSNSKLLKSLKSLHTSSYLTLMSITQGVALGFWAYTVTQDYQNYSGIAYILLAITFCVLVAVWHEYFIAVASLSWIPGILDSFIPFLLLAAQIALISSIKKAPSAWYMCMAILCFVSLFGYLNMYIKSKKYPENQGVLNHLSWLKVFTRWLLIVIMMLEIYFWYKEEYLSPYFFPIITFVMVLIFFLRGCFYWKRIIEYARKNIA